MAPSPIEVSAIETGRTLAALLMSRLRLPRSEVVRLIRKRKVSRNGVPCVDPTYHVRRGQRWQVQRADPQRPESSGPAPIIRHADHHVVVVDKPAGLTTMR